jgi:hypothetical protein
MPSLYSRQDIERSYDARLLRVVIQLFDEFPSVPMLRVIRALKHARGTLQVNSIDLVSPSAVGAAAQQALRDRVALSTEVPVRPGPPVDITAVTGGGGAPRWVSSSALAARSARRG